MTIRQIFDWVAIGLFALTFLIMAGAAAVSVLASILQAFKKPKI